VSGLAIELAERGWLPDGLTRVGIRRLLSHRLGAERERQANGSDLLEQLNSGPLALSTDEANDQHYEVPSRFFELALGRRLKYSCCYWPDGVSTLDDAEEAMLELSCTRAGVADGMEILDLGCGWGSLALWMAEHYPNARILAVSNSSTQRAHIEQRAHESGFGNLEVLTCDVNDFQPDRKFDRVLSIEMFEHMRNYDMLLERVASWLETDGRLFVHIFCHREIAYLFQTDGRQDWMARHFFTDGLMPAWDLLTHFERSMVLEERWRVDGTHYQKTAEAWLEQLDENRTVVESVFRSAYEDPERWAERWRLFFLACAELFGFRGGSEWFVGHYLMKPRSQVATTTAGDKG